MTTQALDDDTGCLCLHRLSGDTGLYLVPLIKGRDRPLVTEYSDQPSHLYKSGEEKQKNPFNRFHFISAFLAINTGAQWI